jgi:thiamine-phosphate pyrophosphorylase
MPVQLPPLYPLTDATLAEPLDVQVARLGAAGFSLVQVRAKWMETPALKAALRAALGQSQAGGGWPRLVVNDRADLASQLAEEGLAPWGVHLGQGDLPPAQAASLPGLGDCHFGTSTHNPSEWATLPGGCDHAGIGPFRATATKGDHAAPVGREGLAEGCRQLRSQGVAPIAIGGLTLDDALDCFQAGAESLAMVGAVHRSPDPRDLGWAVQVARWRARSPLSARGVVLLGPSGAGKSTLGPRLAAGLGLPFRDLDAALEAQAGQSIPQVFAAGGEASFRRLEREVLPGLLASPGVVALGAGAWEQPEVRSAVGGSGFKALWLAEPPRACWQRVAGDPQRPLAQDEATFLRRCAQRIAAWSQAEAISSFGRPVDVLAAALLRG